MMEPKEYRQFTRLFSDISSAMALVEIAYLTFRGVYTFHKRYFKRIIGNIISFKPTTF